MRRRHICYSGAPPIVLTYLDAKGDSSGSTGAHTYNAAFGAASANRYILVGANITNPSVVDTIGGVAAVELFRVQAGTGTTVAAWYLAHVPTGTSGNITVTSPGGGINWIGGVVVYSLISVSTPTLIDAVTGTNGITNSWPMTAKSGSVALVLLAQGTPGKVWSGGVTLDVALTFGGTGQIESASTHALIAGASITPSWNFGLAPAATSAAIVIK